MLEHMTMAELRKAIREFRKTECPPVSKMSKEDMVAHLQRLAHSKKQGKKLPVMSMKEKEVAKKAVKKAVEKVVEEVADKKATKKTVEKAVEKVADKIEHVMETVSAKGFGDFEDEPKLIGEPSAPMKKLTPEEKARREKELDELMKNYTIGEGVSSKYNMGPDRKFVPPPRAAAKVEEKKAAPKAEKAKKEKKAADSSGNADRMAMVQKIKKARGVTLKEAHALYAEGVRV